MKNSHLLILGGILLLLNACVTHENLLSLQKKDGKPYPEQEYIEQMPAIKIQPDDILSIKVYSFNVEAVLPFNPTTGVGGEGGAGGGEPGGGAPVITGTGYLVDENGYIDFPVIGKIRLKGLSREEAKEKIRQLLLSYVKDPTVEIRFLNFHVSIFGEVRTPGIFTFPDEKFSIIEALAMAGGMTDLANQSNILLIREEDNIRKFGRIDISSNDVFQSNYFYLHQNDVIYIEPLKQKTATVADPVTRVLAIMGGVLATTSILITTFR